MALSYQRLTPENKAHVRAYQDVLEQAPGYYLAVEGRLPASDAAEEDLNLFPKGKTLEDKFSYLILDQSEGVGCLDVVRGYPLETTAFIGLLLFSEPKQGCGLGANALAYVRSLALSWGCEYLRIAVISTNIRAFKFWQREGFVEVERKKNARFLGESVVMEATLSAVSAV